jgi:hypothetical protein
MNAVVSTPVSVRSMSNVSGNTTNTAKTLASSDIPAGRGTLNRTHSADSTGSAGTLHRNRSHSSDSTGSAGIFVKRLGQKRMPMSTGRSIPMPSLYFRKSSVPVHEPPTLLHRTGDESAQFSQDHLEEDQQQQQQQQQQQYQQQQHQQQQAQPQQQYQKQAQPQDQHPQQEQPQEYRKQPPPPQYPQEDSMSAQPLQFPERPAASTWFCRYCSYANVDLENSGCAVCGMDSTTTTTGTMATAKEVPYSHQDISSASPTTFPTYPAMEANAMRSVSSSNQSASFSAGAAAHHLGPAETASTIVSVNPFDEVSLMPVPTTLNRYITPTTTTTPSHDVPHQQQDGPGSLSTDGTSTLGRSDARTISNLPTPRASNVTSISDRSETCSLDLSQESTSSSPPKAVASRSFWRPLRRNRRASTGASPDTLRLPDPGEPPVMPIRRKTPEVQ